MNYMDRRTKRFKNLEKSVCNLVKKETGFNAFKIESITDSPFTYYEENMLRILVKFKHKVFYDERKYTTAECGKTVLVNKDLFMVVNDWSDAVLKKDEFLILDICPGEHFLQTV